MRGISQLIDAGTIIRAPVFRGFKNFSSGDVNLSTGYVAFVVGGKLHQRVIQANNALLANHNTINYIVWRKEVIAIDMPMPPISGAFNAESFKA